METLGNDRPLQGALLPCLAMGFTVLWAHQEVQLILRLMGARARENKEGRGNDKAGTPWLPLPRPEGKEGPPSLREETT